MSSSRSNLQIREDLVKIVDQVELRLIEKGFIVPREEIFGYLLEIVVNKTEFEYNALVENFGHVNKIADELAGNNDIIWPVDPWYGGVISSSNFQNSQNASQSRSSNFMRTVVTAHNISLIASIYIIIRVLLSLALALLQGNPSSFEIIIDLTPYNIGVFIWYPLFAILGYSSTARITHNTELRSATEDMETWLSKIRRTAYIHTLALFSFYGFYSLGSLSEVREGSSSLVIVRPANGIPIRVTVILILVSFYFYQIGLKKILFDSSGGEYWNLSLYPRRLVRVTVSSLIRFKQLLSIMIIVAYIIVSNYYYLLVDLEINQFLGLDQSFILVCFIYFIVNLILNIILFSTENIDQVRFWFRSSIQTDFFGVFAFALLSYMIYELKDIVARNRAVALPGYSPSSFTDYFLLPILVISSMIFMIQASFILFKYKFNHNTNFLKFLFSAGYNFRLKLES